MRFNITSITCGWLLAIAFLSFISVWAHPPQASRQHDMLSATSSTANTPDGPQQDAGWGVLANRPFTR